MGLYIYENTPRTAIIHCSFDYPVIAYYAQRITLYFPPGKDTAWNALSSGDYLVVTSGTSPNLNESLAHGLVLVKVIRAGSWNLALLQR
jgi:hypothetical protein